jgi:pseudoazurin
MKLKLTALLAASVLMLSACSEDKPASNEAPVMDKPAETMPAEKMPEVKEAPKMEPKPEPMPEPKAEMKPEEKPDMQQELKNKAADIADKTSNMVDDAKKEVTAMVDKAKQEMPKSEAPAGTGKVHVVKMLNNGEDGIMVFEPGYIKIEKGDTVQFEATDAGHNAVSELTPDGNKWEVGYDGGKVTFNEEGAHLYYCVPHRSMGMWGVIQVGNAVNKDDFMAESKSEDGSLAMNSGRIMKYADQVK